MSVQLLDKTRKINRLLHNNTTDRFVFNDICSVLSETLSSNTLVLSRKGKILGYGEGFESANSRDTWHKVEVGRFIDDVLNERLLGILSTMENVNPATLGFNARPGAYFIIVAPIEIAGERLGTLLAYRKINAYDIDDIIVTEYGGAVVGLEMLRSMTEEAAEELRKRQVVRSCFDTLTDLEKAAVRVIFDELNGAEGILVASKLADESQITRSVIVNALRKLESAGIIESRSSGMKGTYIKVCNEFVYDGV